MLGWIKNLLIGNIETPQAKRVHATPKPGTPSENSNRSSAYNRLRLVLMHDRTQLEPHLLEQMRDEMVAVISKYVQIDQPAIELNLENDPETNTIALVANIPVLKGARSVASIEAAQQEQAKKQQQSNLAADNNSSLPTKEESASIQNQEAKAAESKKESPTQEDSTVSAQRQPAENSVVV